MLVNVLKTIASSQEIVDAITAAIRDGELLPGDVLPSVRTIADISGVSPGTVALAFRVLRDRSVITTAHGRRAHVSSQPVAQRTMDLQIPSGAINLAIVGPDPALLPDANAILARGLFRPSLYDSTNVEPQLRAVMTEAFTSDGIVGELTVVNGALDALERVLRVHLKRGDSIIVEDPSWSSALGLLNLLGLNPVPAAVDDDGIIPAALKSALASRHISAILLTPRAQNPYGSAMTAERAAELTEIIDLHPHLVVIEDDHARPTSHEITTTLTSRRARFAVIRSMNKSLGPDLRLAVVASDSKTADSVQRRILLGPGWVSHFVQRLAAEMLTDATTLAAVQHAASTYRRRRESFVHALQSRGVCAHGKSGLTVLIPVPDETAVVSRLLLKGWAVRGGTQFRLDSAPFIRVCTATLDVAQGEALADDIAQLLIPGRQMNTP